MVFSYQVRFAVLQAGAYGLPQGRHRIVYIAAKNGTPLPDFPLPTHQFPTPPPSVKLPTGNTAPMITRECVPHRQIHAKDALLDLPGFHWFVSFSVFIVKLCLIFLAYQERSKWAKSSAQRPRAPGLCATFRTVWFQQGREVRQRTALRLSKMVKSRVA
jgi:site-specific DNA-cytosine methylase